MDSKRCKTAEYDAICRRRAFLKKAVYHTPVIYALGSLVKPTLIMADASGGPSGPPGGFFSSSSSSSSSKRVSQPKPRRTLRF